MENHIARQRKKSGRRLVAKSNYNDLLDVIIEYYSRIEDKKYICNVQYTLRKLYPDWLKIKYNHTASPSYIRRIQNDWNKYYENDKIVDIPIKDLTYLQLDEWAHNIIKKYEMNKKTIL